MNKTEHTLTKSDHRLDESQSNNAWCS